MSESAINEGLGIAVHQVIAALTRHGFAHATQGNLGEAIDSLVERTRNEAARRVLVEPIRRGIRLGLGAAEKIAESLGPKHEECQAFLRHAVAEAVAGNGPYDFPAGTKLYALRDVEPDGIALAVGRLPTANGDEYPGLGDWWVQLRVEPDRDEVFARVYGDSPEQARSRAERVRDAMAAICVADRSATDSEVAEWVERHDLGGALNATDARAAFEDAESHHLVRNHESASARNGWVRTSERLPPVAEGRDGFYWIAIRRASGKVHTFPAVYANRYPLCSSDDDPCEASGPGWSQEVLDENDEGDIAVSGWYDIKSDDEFDYRYVPVCDKGDEVIAWHAGPEFTDLECEPAAAGGAK